MKKSMSKFLALVMILSSFFAFGLPVFAEGEADATSSATTWEETTTNGGGGMSYENPVFVEGTAVYTVKSGDVFWKIASAHDLTVAELLALNPQVKNANMIYVGQELAVKAATTTTVDTSVLYHGLGQIANFRDRSGNYSVNVTMASAIFDAEGKIVDVTFDVYEIGTAEFPSWPNEELSVQTISQEVLGWQTKRDRGDAYGMAAKATTGNEWYTQLNNYQEFFKGQTVAEIRAWFNRSTNASGKPIVATTTNEDELAKYNALTDDQKAELADVTSGATMSLSDAHSMFMEALEKAWANKTMVK